MRTRRGAGYILAGKSYYWTNWDYEQRFFNMSLLKHPCYAVPDDWIGEMFDDQYSAYLLPIPMIYCN